MSTPLPDRLYKFEDFAARALLNLKSQVVYFGSPKNFNDPYDCAVTPEIRPPSDELVEKIRRQYLDDKDLPSKTRAEFLSKSVEELRQVYVGSARAALTQQIDNVVNTCGITCFSERNDDLTMWSHYGGRYKGICLEFATSHELFSRAQPVRYVAKMPSYDAGQIIYDRSGFDPVELFCTKSLAWSYEEEWRAIHKVGGTAYVYPADILTGVYFGPDIEQQALEIVCLILASQNERVRFWQGRRSTTEFRVLFEEFTYTSYLEAKRKGLRD